MLCSCKYHLQEGQVPARTVLDTVLPSDYNATAIIITVFIRTLAVDYNAKFAGPQRQSITFLTCRQAAQSQAELKENLTQIR